VFHGERQDVADEVDTELGKSDTDNQDDEVVACCALASSLKWQPEEEARIGGLA
jgi:hypothetical protein